MSLKATDVRFGYSKREPIIDGLSLEVQPGERVVLYGPSGRGKTTLCRLLAGFVAPDSGSITVDDEPLSPRGVRPVQLIWQHPEQSLDPRLSTGRSLREAGPLDQALLEALGIKPEWLERRPGELSGGEVQRICIARALRVDLKYLIADEITTMLDPISQADIWHFLMAELEARGVGLLAVTHDARLAARIADRVIRLNDERPGAGEPPRSIVNA